jgi:hypothetical protein
MEKLTGKQTSSSSDEMSLELEELEIESCPSCGREGVLCHEQEMVLATGVQAPRVCRTCRTYLVTQNLIAPESMSGSDLRTLGPKNVVSVERAAQMLKTSQAMVRHHLRNGKLLGIKDGKAWEIYLFSVYAYLLKGA